MRWKKRRWRDDERKKWEKRKQSEEVAGEGKEQRQNTTCDKRHKQTGNQAHIVCSLTTEIQTGTNTFPPASRTNRDQLVPTAAAWQTAGFVSEFSLRWVLGRSQRRLRISRTGFQREASVGQFVGCDGTQDQITAKIPSSSFILLHPPSSSILLRADPPLRVVRGHLLPLWSAGTSQWARKMELRGNLVLWRKKETH